MRPTKPKYVNTWDPDDVLTKLKSFKYDEISLECLSHKLALLLALATRQRVQTLSKIELTNIFTSPRGIQRSKTSDVNKIQPKLFLPFFKEDSSICVASTLICYL